MNDNDPWPRVGQTSRSSVVRTLAHSAGWRLTEMPADLGLPLAGCLYSEKNNLLVTTTEGNLATSIAVMDGALIATRSDALIVRAPTESALPDFALGIWRSGRITWHWLLTLWVDVNAGLWLVPTPDRGDATGSPGSRLTAQYLRIEEAPWRTVRERAEGLVRAIRILNYSEDSPASGHTDAGDQS